MKISKRSWHYRWVNYCEFTIPHNLCGYFWLVVWSVTVVPLILILMSPVLLVLFGVQFAAWLADKYKDRRDRKRSERGYVAPQRIYKAREPSLFRKWLKAKKDKVCPLIEFTDDKQES